MRRLIPLVTTLVLLAAAPASAQWGETPPLGLGPDEAATCLRDAGGGRVAALAQRGKRYGTALFTVAPDGLHADGDVLLGRSLLSCPAVAVADSGAAVAAAVVLVGRPVRRPRLLVSVREPGGAFGSPVELARGVDVVNGISVSAAIGDDGRAAVAWTELHADAEDGVGRQALRVARRAPGMPFGVPETLAKRMPAGYTAVGPAVALDRAGGVTVAWTRRRSAGWLPDDVGALDVAVAAPDAAFGPPQPVAKDVPLPERVSLAVAPDGAALLAYGGGERVRVHERPAGAPSFGAEPVLRADTGAWDPVVALALDGGAVAAWRTDQHPGAGGVVAQARPPGGGAFGPPQRLHDGEPIAGRGWTAYAGLGGPLSDEHRWHVRASAAPGGRAAVTWTTDPAAFGVADRGGIAVADGGVFAPAAALGSPVRDIDGVLPWLGADGPSAIWSDNALDGLSEGASGRLHTSQPARSPGVAPAPAVRLSARPQTIHRDEPLRVDAHCSAACDLRATIAGHRRIEGLDGRRAGSALGAGTRATPGTVRLRLHVDLAGHIARRGGGRVRVVVRAAAPGGTEVRTSAVRVRVRRRPVPPFRRPLDVRARRDGDDVIVTWRTAGPARRMTYQVSGGLRGDRVSRWFAVRVAHGERHFRIRLRDAAAARELELAAFAADPPYRTVKQAVRVR